MTEKPSNQGWGMIADFAVTVMAIVAAAAGWAHYLSYREPFGFFLVFAYLFVWIPQAIIIGGIVMLIQVLWKGQASKRRVVAASVAVLCVIILVVLEHGLLFSPD